ncbi:putative bifunctional diguanylate cyclase/phosphodiesterase [Granulosicoccus sp. 3-233]|uniref:putative bifunctional diguanylate cyclase/phosphodiesterase n=1 Tax=Granulosicoccus sp. 3-233 TaxID=3417969 RepID=UPI003D34070F
MPNRQEQQGRQPELRRRSESGLVDPRLRNDVLALILFVGIGTMLSVRFSLVSHLQILLEQHESIAWLEGASFLIVLLLGTLGFLIRRLYVLQSRMASVASQPVVEIVEDAGLHDPVTELPGRQMWKRRLEQELSRSVRERSQVAVIALDLDRFKQVNDVFGQDVGDALLRVMANRLTGVVRDMDTLLRMGADEFLIIQPGLDSHDGAVSLAKRLIAATVEPMQVGEHQIPMSISIGIVLSSSDCRDCEKLLQRANIALDRAKVAGGSVYRFYEAEMDLQLQLRQRMEQDLRKAIDKGSLALHYQPLFNVTDQRLLGFEALLRWQHAELGFVSPADFIPLAEETGLIMGIGEWVLEQACRDALLWAGDRKIAVNLSPIQFRDPELPSKIAAIIKRTGLPPERLELEITEGVLIEDADTALAMLVELKALGVRISMDDFGTGYSSLSYLKRFPFDKIKIDRSFVSQLVIGSEDAAIVRAILALGHSLGMIATAEGVESAEQFDYLQLEGCDEAQGFLLGRPMPFEYALALCKVPDGQLENVVRPLAAAHLPRVAAGRG